ncbi:GNAT family N-acetyltransferase [Petralouisia muris]|jgi:predicted acetyltransferase|uniref:GNAT family N-acetyltransferase n=1 Tax=Petralouisia muris TaxID=3032872 RepID=A0AC61S0M2_9FIRM|nr:GNAT family N-acetyltransferase [Petralouisia muris]TGY97487.1 GNAT family N-acetyltransferase [Petralouisia muris]
MKIPEFLETNEIKLILERTFQEDKEKGYVPACCFAICDKKEQKIGACDLRMGHNENTYYGGNIGYEIEESYRGRHYAQKACKALLQLAKACKMEYVLITCNPDNIASRKTSEYAGGVLEGIVELPEGHELRSGGRTQSCIYRIDLE